MSRVAGPCGASHSGLSVVQVAVPPRSMIHGVLCSMAEEDFRDLTGVSLRPKCDFAIGPLSMQSGHCERPRRGLPFSTWLQVSAKTDHFIACKNFRASHNRARTCLRSAIASLVNRPCLRAFWFPLGGPVPGAQPCMRQRFLPRTAGERHAPPERILAPHRGLARIGPLLRA